MALQSTETQAQGFGERVKRAREEKRMSRADLAERAGISRPYLWQLEDGRSRPSLDYAVRIAHALGVSVTQLIGEERLEPRPAAVRVREGIPETRRMDGALKFFWTFLCARAVAIQKAYRYDKRNFPLNGEYRIILDYFDKVLRSGEIEDDCIAQAIEAVKQESAARMSGDRFDEEKDEEKLEQVIEAWRDAERLAGRGERTEAIVAVKWSLGNALNVQYQYDQALKRLEYVHALIGDESSELSIEDIAGLYTTLGWVSYYVAHFHQAANYFQDAERKWKMVSGERSSATRYEGLAATYRGLGSTYQRIDEFELAEQAFEEMLEVAADLANTKNGNKIHFAWAQFRAGSFYKHAGDWRRSDEYLTQADRLWAELEKEGKIDYGLQLLKTMILNNCADLLVRKGVDYAKAREYLEKSLRIGKEVRDKRAMAYSHWFLAALYMSKGEWDKALLHLDLSEQQFLGMKIWRYVWSARVSKARVYCELGLGKAAESLIEQVATSQMESPSQRALILATRAFVHARNQQWDKAREDFEKSISDLRILPYETIVARLDYAEMLVEVEQFDQAHEELDLAQQAADGLGAKGLLKRVKTIEKVLQEIPAKQTA